MSVRGGRVKSVGSFVRPSSAPLDYARDKPREGWERSFAEDAENAESAEDAEIVGVPTLELETGKEKPEKRKEKTEKRNLKLENEKAAGFFSTQFLAGAQVDLKTWQATRSGLGGEESNRWNESPKKLSSNLAGLLNPSRLKMVPERIIFCRGASGLFRPGLPDRKSVLAGSRLRRKIRGSVRGRLPWPARWPAGWGGTGWLPPL